MGHLEVVESNLYLKAGLLPALGHVNCLSTLLLFFGSQIIPPQCLTTTKWNRRRGKDSLKTSKGRMGIVRSEF